MQNNSCFTNSTSRQITLLEITLSMQHKRNNYTEFLNSIYNYVPQLQHLIVSTEIVNRLLSTTFYSQPDQNEHSTIKACLKSLTLRILPEKKNDPSLDDLLAMIMKRSHRSLKSLDLWHEDILLYRKAKTILTKYGVPNLQEIILLPDTKEVITFSINNPQKGFLNYYVLVIISSFWSLDIDPDFKYHVDQRIMNLITSIGICRPIRKLNLSGILFENEQLISFLKSMKDTNVHTLKIHGPSGSAGEKELKALASLLRLEYPEINDDGKNRGKAMIGQDSNYDVDDGEDNSDYSNEAVCAGRGPKISYTGVRCNKCGCVHGEQTEYGVNEIYSDIQY
ncbi:hypothetical protein BDA99DRAFT_540267 [Phascolomyces articulosus]|uniref:Uncharacterized protein n=1 Tax=Phascolomyces articulosus TaxID=60185 RepID=A0AAD5PB07_9FUNG|nr:hypothetical protein BDA99DRAFT_540267 [Phascolomyces articulosus]